MFIPYRQALAQNYAAKAFTLRPDACRAAPVRESPGLEATGRSAERLSLLGAALEDDSSNPLALQQLVDLMRTDAKDADKARALLEPLLAGGQTPAHLHLLMGDKARRSGRFEEARGYFE